MTRNGVLHIFKLALQSACLGCDPLCALVPDLESPLPAFVIRVVWQGVRSRFVPPLHPFQLEVSKRGQRNKSLAQSSLTIPLRGYSR